MGFFEEVLDPLNMRGMGNKVERKEGEESVYELAYMATDGLTSGVSFEQTRLFLRRCESAGEELAGYTDEEYDELLSQSADDVVPYGDYDRWLIFTDLIGFRSEYWADSFAFVESGETSENAAWVLYHYAFDCISKVARKMREED